MVNRNEYFRNYMREYRKKNPEKVKEYNRRYWEKKIALYHQEQEQENKNNG